MKEERRSYLKSKKPAAQILRGLLGTNEQIHWQGQPIPKYAFWSGVRGDSLFTKILFLVAALVATLPFSAPGGYWAYKST